MWTPTSAAAGIRPNVSISGASARSVASRLAAVASSSRRAPSITTTERPLRNGGSSGSGGKCITRSVVVADSGAVPVQAAHARATASVCRASHSSMPAWTVSYGSRSISSETTIPNAPDPPRTAQNTSGCSSGAALRMLPSAVTS